MDIPLFNLKTNYPFNLIYERYYFKIHLCVKTNLLLFFYDFL